MRVPRSLAVVALAAAVLLPGCAGSPTNPPTLYSRLGGAPVVKRFVDETIERAAVDARTRRSFQGVKLRHVEDMIAEQICELAGGGCKYSGDPMDKVHKGLKNTAAEMDVLVQFLREACDHAGVGIAEKNELLRLLAPMKRDIVTG